MTETDQEQQNQKQLHFGLLLLISFLVFNLGNIIGQTISWSDHYNGLMNGLCHVMILGVAWCVYLLPWSLFIFYRSRRRKWKRFRTHWVLAPAVLTLLVSIGLLIVDPPTASNRFRNFAKTELPKNIQNLHFEFTGGGVADYNDTYYFETSPAEVDRLIAEMGLKNDEFYGRKGLFQTSISVLPDCPDFSTWQDAKQFRREDDKWFYYLITDATKTKVYILIGCT